MKLRFAAITDTGRVRPHNEDQVLGEESLFAVADGLGGHAAGEVASQVAIEALKASFARDRSAEGLVHAVQDANTAVWERAHDDPELRGMSTTLTAAAPVGEDSEQQFEVVNVGDSRAYLLRDGELEQISEDHSLVEELVRSGRLAPEDAASHPQKNIVTRALGMETRDGNVAEVDVDSFTIVPFKSDRVLLASDGLTNEVSDSEIASILRRYADPNEAARELVRVANENGGNDNISVVIVDVVDDDAKAETASKALADEPAPPPSEPATAASPSARVREAPRVASPRRSAARRPRRPRQPLGVRVVLFIVAVAAVLGLAVIAITWYAKGSYYVGVRDNNVTIFRGRPGGFLWVKPTVVSRSTLKVDEVAPAKRARLNEGEPEPTLGAARHYIDNLRDEAATLATTTTSSTVAPPTTAAK